MQYYDGIHFGDGCDYSPRGTWLCTNVNEIEIEGIPHLTKPYPANVPIISGNDHSRIFWVAGAKLKVSNIIVEKGEDVSFKPTTNHQSFVPPMIIDRNLNNWRGDGFSVPGLQKNVCAEQQYPQRGFKEKDTKCNFV